MHNVLANWSKYLIAFWNDLQPYVFCICVFARCIYFCIWETSMGIRVHQNIKKFSEFHSHLIYVVSIDIWKKTKIAKNNDFWGVFLSWLTFCRKCPFYALKRAQNSEFAYYASKSGKWIKQTPTPPFWGDVGVKKWSQILDWATRSPIFGHLKKAKRRIIGKFWILNILSSFLDCKKGIFYKMVARRGKYPKNIFLHFWSSFI